MAYQVALSPSARRDLREIVRYISFDSPDRARAFGEFLLGQAKRIGHFPEMGRVVPEISEETIREMVARSYRIIYRVDHSDCRIDIIRFWHGARGNTGTGRYLSSFASR